MMITILTLPLHTNFGGVLQAYSLQTILERMGHEVIVLDKDSFTLAVNDTFNLPISVKLGNEIINDALISYTIGNPQVVSISNNVVTALSAGTTKCVATASYLEEEVSKGFNITVY